MKDEAHSFMLSNKGLVVEALNNSMKREGVRSQVDYQEQIVKRVKKTRFEALNQKKINLSQTPVLEKSGLPLN